MHKIETVALPYQVNSAQLFAKIKHLPGAIYLDSSQPYGEQGRYDIMVALPKQQIITRDHHNMILHAAGIDEVDGDPFSLIQQLLKPYEIQSHEFPFAIGAVGFFSYDLGAYIENLPQQAIADTQLPDMTVGIYLGAIIVDHKLEKINYCYLNNDEFSDQTMKKIIRCLHSEPVEDSDFRLTTDWQADIEQTQYEKNFNRIHHYLTQGDCYQVNYTQRFHSSYQGSPWQAYLKLRQQNPAPFAAFIPTAKGAILSVSPERFLQVNNSHVETKPIKGTTPRGTTVEQDQQLAQALKRSEKDRAENLMIVDLMRNDLSKVCQNHSVHVPKLCALESFPAVHHLVSTVTGELKPDCDALDLLRACFPGGSITGTPKIRAQHVIDELEPSRRNIYCGSIGYIDCSGKMDTSITIRTLLCEDNTIYCNAGGGLVIDSIATAEYAECFAKINNIMEILSAI